MIAKKFLSVVALLFIGGQISFVAAEWVDCTTNSKYNEIDDYSTDCEVTAYCKDSDLIVGIDDGENPTCKKAMDGVLVFDDSVGTFVDLTGKQIGVDVTATNVAIYNCDGNNCEKTNGIIKDKNNDYYIVDTTEGAEAITATHKDAQDDCTTTPESKIGMIASDTLCLGDSITAATAAIGKRYIMNNVSGNAFTGGQSDTDKQIVIKTGTQIFAYDNLIKDDEYCVTTVSNLLTGRFDNFCSSDECDHYYSCKSQICEYIDEANESCPSSSSSSNECTLESSSAQHCEQGYYLKGTNSGKLAKADDEEGTLYYCKSKTQCDPATAGDVKIGYYRNVDTVNTNVQYIKCETAKSNLCKAVIISKTGCDNDGIAIGDLVVVGGTTYNICLGIKVTDAVEINTTHTSKSYLISVNTENLFGSKAKQYVKINTVDANVVLSDKETSPQRYLYTDTDSLIHSKQSSGVCDRSTTIIEFKINKCEDDVDPENDTVNYYKKGADHTWPSA